MMYKNTIYPVTTEIEEETEQRAIEYIQNRLAEQRKQAIIEKANELGMDSGVQKLMLEMVDTAEKQEELLMSIEREKPTDDVTLFALAKAIKL